MGCEAASSHIHDPIADGEALDPGPYRPDNTATFKAHLARATFDDAESNNNVLLLVSI